MKYKHLTQELRYQIYAFSKANWTQKEIADDLMTLEKDVMSASAEEEKYIHLLYSIVSKNNYSLFHYDLWHAPLALKHHQYSEA